MKPMAIMRLAEYMQTEEWTQLSDHLREQWIKHFCKASELEITKAYLDGKYKSEGYENSEDYIKTNFEI
jgi:hypothetical protein